MAGLLQWKCADGFWRAVRRTFPDHFDFTFRMVASDFGPEAFQCRRDGVVVCFSSGYAGMGRVLLSDLPVAFYSGDDNRSFPLLGYTCIKNKWLSVLAGLLALPLIYFLAGNRLNFFVLLILFYETGKEPKRWLYWGLLLVTGVFMPVWMMHFYSLTQEQAYLYPHNGLPSFFPPLLFCFSLLFLQIRKFRDMPIRVLPVIVTVCILLALLGIFIFLIADF